MAADRRIARRTDTGTMAARRGKHLQPSGPLLRQLDATQRAHRANSFAGGIEKVDVSRSSAQDRIGIRDGADELIEPLAFETRQHADVETNQQAGAVFLDASRVRRRSAVSDNVRTAFTTDLTGSSLLLQIRGRHRNGGPPSPRRGYGGQRSRPIVSEGWSGLRETFWRRSSALVR